MQCSTHEACRGTCPCCSQHQSLACKQELVDLQLSNAEWRYRGGGGGGSQCATALRPQVLQCSDRQTASQPDRQVLGLFRTLNDAAGPVSASASAVLFVGTVSALRFIRRTRSPNRVAMLTGMNRRELVRVSCGVQPIPLSL